MSTATFGVINDKGDIEWETDEYDDGTMTSKVNAAIHHGIEVGR